MPGWTRPSLRHLHSTVSQLLLLPVWTDIVQETEQVLLVQHLVQLCVQDSENPFHRRGNPPHCQVRLQTVVDVGGPLIIGSPHVMLPTAVWVVYIAVWVVWAVWEALRASRQPIGIHRGVTASNQHPARR